jgi:ABC-2 type transport system ATP-binding protein
VNVSADEGRIVIDGLTKHFGAVRAVDQLSFTVEPGSVTGFLGPNGAGKTTTLRTLLGLVAPTAGTATIGGRRYAELADPVRTVGAALEASSFYPGRSAQDHLRVLCVAGGLPESRADEALVQVGLADAARRRVGGFSLGMRQRLALAAALLGDPGVLILDEPANGIDPEGIAWLRGFLRYFADQGRTVLISSHVLAEVAQTVDSVVIINRGRLVKQETLEELTASARPQVVVRTPHAGRLGRALEADGLVVEHTDPDTLLVEGDDAAVVGRVALRELVELHELCPRRSGLERVFLELTADDRPAELASPQLPQGVAR